MNNPNQHSLFEVPAKTIVKKPQKTATPDIVKSRKLKTKLSQFLSPYSVITSVKSILPDYNGVPPYLKPQVKIVQYGTGTGKSYGALKQYLLLQGMGYSDEHKAKHGLLHRQKGRNNFTNAVFITPNKNQINFDKELIEEMLALGITPISVQSIQDTYDAKNKLWADGKYTTIERLNDLEKAAQLILDTHKNNRGVMGWERGHTRSLKVSIAAIKAAVIALERLKIEKHKYSKEEYEDQEKVLAGAHNKAAQTLVMSCFNNVFSINRAVKSGLMVTAEQEDEDTLVCDDIVTEEDLDDGASEGSTELTNSMYPIGEADVFDEIFVKAKEKKHFDDLLLQDNILSSKDSFECMLASLKKEVIRVYAPLNYAMYLPSFICMTSDKFRVKPAFYRKSLRVNDESWKFAALDYSNFPELIGDKYSHNKAMIPVPSTLENAKDKQLEMLKDTLLRSRAINVDYDFNEVDERSGFVKNDINFYVIVDESNEMFNKAFLGSDLNAGVVKPIIDKFSITDILSCVERKYSEFSTQKPGDIDCYKQLKFFFEAMFAYIESYCEIDPKKVFKVVGDGNESGSYLLQFGLPPNILYIDNSEASSIIDIVKNAFSVTAKKFIDKDKLQSIYICKKGGQRYLSRNRKSEADMTLYDLYQIIIAILFAAIMVESNKNQGGRFNANERRAFRLDLGGGSGGGDVRRQNEPLAALLTYAKNNAAKYREWLTSDHLNNAKDAIIDDWFAYIQTKLIFSLNLNRDFDASPDIGHQTKTFIDIKLHLVTHHPEIDILKMAYNTTNYIHIMSATSGREHAYSGQYNIKFLKSWGRSLGVETNTPEYDHAYDIDYRGLFVEFRKHREKLRTIDVIAYKDLSDVKKMFSPKLGAGRKLSISRGVNLTLTVKELESHLLAVNSSLGRNSLYMPDKTYNYTAFQIALAGLLTSFVRMDNTLLISYTMSLTTLLLASIRAEFDVGSVNLTTLSNALRDQQTTVTFSHTIFGKFQLPMLNDYLSKNKSSLSLKKLKTIRESVFNQYCYAADLFDLAEGLDMPTNKIVRLAMFDSKIGKVMSDYQSYFVAKQIQHKGELRQVYTTIVSYNAAAGLGLNNTIYNECIDTDEDVNRLFLSSLAYWTDINDVTKIEKKDGVNAWGKISNSLVYMRYLADISRYKPTVITDFDSNISGYEANELLRTEHNIQRNNNFKQVAGRPERKDAYSDFKSEFILPEADLKEQTKINFLTYQLDKDLKPHRDKTDFAFMSMNNYRVLEVGAELVFRTSMTPSKRQLLEHDTQDSKERIEFFTDSAGFMGKLLRAARQGDDGPEAKRLAIAAIAFDEAYRRSTILSCPERWLEDLNNQELLKDPSLLSKMGWADVSTYLDSMYVDLKPYKKDGDIEVYQHVRGVRKLGLTDFFGEHGGNIEAYNPSAHILPSISVEEISKADDRFKKLAIYNNSLIDTDSDFYNQPYDKDFLLHPAMMHMALGNIGEQLFSYFLTQYEGNYFQYSNNDIVESYGYQYYEMFDFWLFNRETSQFICVDVKNFSHKEGIDQTKRLLGSADTKALRIESSIFETGTDSEAKAQALALIDLFKKSNEMHIVYLNVRHNEHSSEKLVERVIDVNGRKLVVKIHYLTLFHKFRFLTPKSRDLTNAGVYKDGTKRKPSTRESRLSVNSRLMTIMGIERRAIIENEQDIAGAIEDVEFDITTSSKTLFPSLTQNAGETTETKDIKSNNN